MSIKNEQNLDPEDWDLMTSLGRDMVTEMMGFLRDVGDRPVWKAIPDETKRFLNEDIPSAGIPAEEIYRQFKEHILPYAKGNIHPRFWAWVQGTGTPLGMLADMLASGMNSNVTIGEQSAVYVDRQVVDWCRQMMGMPDTTSGMLLSGGSMANTTALLVARNTMLPDVREKGIWGLKARPVMYCSSETHGCVVKAAEAIGIGTEGLRKISVHADFTIDIKKLEDQIKTDLAGGLRPFCIVGNVGTVNTGAIDDLSALTSLRDKYRLWLHLDGAFGALAKLVPEYAGKLKPIETADSVAFDLHKWMYMPYEVGCVLIARKPDHRNSFAGSPNYLLHHERGLASGPESLNNYGLELSRGFKALKVWMSLKEHGMAKYAGQIEKNIRQARYLGRLIELSPLLEPLAGIPLNIVCFRYNDGSEDNRLNAVNKEIVMTLQERGIASPSSTVINGIYAIRVAITNHRSRYLDFDELVRYVLEIGDSARQKVP